MTTEVEKFIQHAGAVTISEKPWSDYSEADYSIEQWHNACLIHQHSGPPTAKTQCKLPVKTPNGTVNKNGVIAAVEALAGARGGLKASPEEKKSAARALARYYGQMDMQPPPSMKRIMAQSTDMTSNFLEHVGVRGMRWGVRRGSHPGHPSLPRLGKPSKDQNVKEARKKILNKRRRLSDADLNKYIDRLGREKRLKDLIEEDVTPGKSFAKRIMTESGHKVARTVLTGAALYGVKAAMEKKFSAKEASQYIAPRPKIK